MACIPGDSVEEKMKNLIEMNYKDQSIWFLNCYWEEWGEGEAEQLWDYVQKCNELDLDKHEDGNGLDEMKAHVFLEAFNETLTVRALRAKLRESGAIGQNERPKLVPISHYLLFKYNADWRRVCNSVMGDNQAELAKAQAMLEEVQALYKEAAQREQESKKSAAELKAALEALHAQQEAYDNKTEELKAKSEQGGIVSKNRAKAQLEIHLSEDPLPLNRAKLTTNAAKKKADKAAAAATAAREAAEAKVEEAKAYLDELKSQSGSAQGSLWWIERELHEAKKYLPESKGGIRR